MHTFLLVSWGIVRMMWWFLILAVSGGAVLWAGIALYFRVRSYMKEMASKEVAGKD